MKKQANKFRSERQFAVGDLVYLKLQPYIQLSVSRRAHQKLAFNHIAFWNASGKLLYRLELPSTASVHHVFHVS
jgi:hypothetical protein